MLYSYGGVYIQLYIYRMECIYSSQPVQEVSTGPVCRERDREQKFEFLHTPFLWGENEKTFTEL